MGRAKKDGGAGEPDKREDVLQAVVLADGTFSKALHPLTLERPLALVPLLGVPLLEHTLEARARARAAPGSPAALAIASAYSNPGTEPAIE